MALALGVEAFGGEVVDNIASLGKAIDAFADLEVDPPVPSMRAESVFKDEVFRNVREFYTEILVAVEGCVQVEVGYVEDCEPGAFVIDNTFDEDIEKLK